MILTGSTTLAQEGPRVTVHGVVQAPSTSPWIGAEVHLVSELVPGVSGSFELDRITVRTDSQGRYRADVLPWRSYQTWVPPNSEGLYVAPTPCLNPGNPLKLVARRARRSRGTMRIALAALRDSDLPLRIELRDARTGAFLLEYSSDKPGPIPQPQPARGLGLHAWTSTGLPLAMPGGPLRHTARRWVVHVKPPPRPGFQLVDEQVRPIAGVRALAAQQVHGIPIPTAATAAGLRGSGAAQTRRPRVTGTTGWIPGSPLRAHLFVSEAHAPATWHPRDAPVSVAPRITMQPASTGRWRFHTSSGSGFGLITGYSVHAQNELESCAILGTEFRHVKAAQILPALGNKPGSAWAPCLVLTESLRRDYPASWRKQLPILHSLPLPPLPPGREESLDVGRLAALRISVKDATGTRAAGVPLFLRPLNRGKDPLRYFQPMKLDVQGERLALLPRSTTFLAIVGDGASSQGYLVRINDTDNAHPPRQLDLHLAQTLAIPFRAVHQGRALKAPFGFEQKWTESRQPTAAMPAEALVRTLAKPLAKRHGPIHWRRLSPAENWSLVLEGGRRFTNQTLDLDAQGRGRIVVPAMPQQIRLQLRLTMYSKSIAPVELKFEVKPGAATPQLHFDFKLRQRR